MENIESHSDQVINEMNEDKELEEAAKLFSNSFKNLICDNGKTNYLSLGNIKQGFIQGFKAAQSKLYSEEEVKKLFYKYTDCNMDPYDFEDANIWFEQNKKKL